MIVFVQIYNCKTMHTFQSVCRVCVVLCTVCIPHSHVCSVQYTFPSAEVLHTTDLLNCGNFLVSSLSTCPSGEVKGRKKYDFKSFKL